jgi:hypothetical protein
MSLNIQITSNKWGEKMADTPKKGSGTNEGSRSQEYMGRSGGGTADRGSNEHGENVNRYQDPHGNQTLREPSGGSGAGHSRGDESAFLPTESPERERKPNADSGPINPSPRANASGRDITPGPGADAHTQPAEGGRDQFGAGKEEA